MAVTTTPARVLELGTDAGTAFAARMFAQLGAEVIKVELLPDGDPHRHGDAEWSPGADGEPAEVAFHYLHQGKLSVALDLDRAEDATTLRDLVDWAEVALVDQTFGAVRLVAECLAAAPRLVHTSLTPFGATGPYRDWTGVPGAVFAMGGELSMLPGGLGHTMFPDAPPLLPPGAVAEFDGGVIGALVSLAGLYHSECRGADVIDVSSTEACVSLNRWLVSHYDESGWIETRATRSYPYAGMFECADGYVMLQPSTDAQWANLVEMMGSPEWATRPEYRTRAARNEAGKAISTELRRWVMTRTKNDILHGGLKFGIPAAPFRDAAEVASCTQYASRGFFVAYDPDPSGHRDDHSPSVPGLPFAAHPFGPPRLRRAPNLGEHNEAVADLLAEFHSGQRQPAAVVSGGTR